MRNRPRLILFVLLVSAFPSFAQSTPSFGLKLGANLSMFSASINSDPSIKPGFHVGVYLRTGSEKFHFRPEVYFSSQGQKDDYQIPNSGQTVGSTTTTINALNVPLIFEAGGKVTFQFGPQIGILLSGREKGTFGTSKVNDDLTKNMRAADMALVLGLGINPDENFNLGVRYNLGITNVFKEPDGAPDDFPTIANRVIHFYVGYTF